MLNQVYSKCLCNFNLLCRYNFTFILLPARTSRQRSTGTATGNRRIDTHSRVAHPEQSFNRATAGNRQSGPAGSEVRHENGGEPVGDGHRRAVLGRN